MLFNNYNNDNNDKFTFLLVSAKHLFYMNGNTNIKYTRFYSFTENFDIYSLMLYYSLFIRG